MLAARSIIPPASHLVWIQGPQCDFSVDRDSWTPKPVPSSDWLALLSAVARASVVRFPSPSYSSCALSCQATPWQSRLYWPKFLCFLHFGQTVELAVTLVRWRAFVRCNKWLLSVTCRVMSSARCVSACYRESWCMRCAWRSIATVEQVSRSRSIARAKTC